MKSMVWESVKSIIVKDRLRKRRKRWNGKSRGSREKNAGIVTREELTNRVDVASESRMRRRKENEIVNSRRRKEDKTRMLG